ncbi:MAG: prepilin-type N-terminal cleavage/methylation domain-containing protein [Pseudomonadota bacterium]
MTPISDAKVRVTQAGFTLLELLVVLSIILITIGLVIPNLNTLDNSSFNAQVRGAVASLTYTRRIAIVEAQPRTAEFFALDPEGADYDDLREQADDKSLDASWSSESLKLRYQPDPSQPDEEVEHIGITFFPQGGSTGGVLNFALNDRTAMIRIDPITGRIATAYNGEEPDKEF